MNWKVKIVERFDSMLVDVYIYSEESNKNTIYQSDGKCKTFFIGEISNPTFQMPYTVLPVLLEGLLETGVKPCSQSKTEGLLEATKNHLEDMRKLVFRRHNDKRDKVQGLG